MQQLENLQTICTSDSITVFWDKPKDRAGACHYEIKSDGKQQGTTEKTHYTLENLDSDREYRIEIAWYGVDGETEASVPETSSRQQKDQGLRQSPQCLLQTISLLLRTEPEKEKIDITKAPYYALGDGKTMNTEAIQRAIDVCGKHQSVYIPAGVFLTGALCLHSDMELYLEEGAVLQGTDNVEDYLPKIWSRFEGKEMECYSSLLNLGQMNHETGCNCENVVIRGKGTIAGGGSRLAKKVIRTERERIKEELAALGDGIAAYEKADTIPGRVRPKLINISNARHVVLDGLELRDGACWNVHMIYSEQIVTHHCSFHSRGVWNGDGWDPDSSTDCTIFACTFYTQDDSIAIKSGKNPEGNVINKPCERIRIFDCNCAYGHGFAIGSEMSGGLNDIFIWDCDLGNSAYGIELKGTRKRGGYIRNVHVLNCVVPRIMFHSVGYNDDGEGALTPPVFEKCLFEGLEVLGEFTDVDGEGERLACTGIELCGFEEEEYHIQDIVFRDIVLKGQDGTGKGGIFMKYCRNILFEHVQ